MRICDVASLRAAMQGSLHPKWVFFWSHQPASDGSLTQSCCSQWWQSAPFEIDGVSYFTAEHFMMAEKARLFGDAACAENILAATDPGAAKTLGRQVRNFDEEQWRRARFDIVVRGNMAKFTQNPMLADFLVGTGARILVEASPRDQIWGIGLAAHDPRAQDPARWRGLNLLGFALMEVRRRLGVR